MKFESRHGCKMAGKFSPPKEISFSGNLRENWLKWQKEFGFYLTATEANSKPDAVKTSRLLTALGEKGREEYYTFTFTDNTEAREFDTVLQKLETYFAPKKNITYLRYRFSAVISCRSKILMTLLLSKSPVLLILNSRFLRFTHQRKINFDIIYEV